MTTNQLLKSIPKLIEKAFPIPARFRSKLPADIAELSRLLTNKRGERALSYLNRPNLLSAYMHYFLPWNLYRLCLLLPSLDISLSNGDAIIDLGSGTLTFVSALWIARPDLRDKELEFFCVDRSGQALEAGKKFFEALSGESKWGVKLVKEDINFSSHKGTKALRKAKLICAVNLFNELYERIPHNNIEGLKKPAFNAAEFMSKQAAEGAYTLTVEPGIPQSGKFIGFLREALFEMGHTPLAPCTHNSACPLAGDNSHSGASNRAKKWCHFASEDFDPPKELVRLSAAAKLPKERLVYSYLLTSSYKQKTQTGARLISDTFPLPGNRFGCYGCSEHGLVLLTGDKSRIDKLVSGSLVSNFTNTNRIDEKSGAVIMEI